jgi:ankyrin repeat protein
MSHKSVLFLVAVFLLLLSADIYADETYDICYAAFNGNRAEVERLLSLNPDLINAHSKNRGKTPLHYAASVGDEQMVLFLLSRGASVKSRDVFGVTPLHETVNYGNLEMIEILITKGADINSTTDILWTPMHYAAAYGYVDAADTLFSLGAQLDARDVVGGTPLHTAAENGSVDVALLLFTKGASINSQTTFFNLTPLHCAILHGRKEMVKLLISIGANITIKDKSGKTPLDLAEESGDQDLVELFRKTGEKK